LQGPLVPPGASFIYCKLGSNRLAGGRDRCSMGLHGRTPGLAMDEPGRSRLPATGRYASRAPL